MRFLPFFALVTIMSADNQAAAQQANARVFFGHQSVGVNMLDGVRGVAPTLRIAKQAAPSDTGIVIIDALVGENGKPLGKLEDFERQVGQRAALLGAAMFKFCYVDFDEQTDVPRLFAAYVRTHERIHAAHPKVRLAHITTPLTVVQTGPKAWLKELMGRAPWGVIENQKRVEFNALVRSRYLGRDPVFDLAELEARSPTGQRAAYEVEGKSIPMLYDGYTDDGRHLNEAGRRTIGAAFAKFVVSLGTR
jgi:hypothetical protein